MVSDIISIWPALASAAAAILLVAVIIILRKNAVAHNILNVLAASDTLLIAIFGERVGVIFTIINDIVDALSDEKVTLEEAQMIAEDVIVAAIKQFSLELSVPQAEVLMFVVNRIIEAIIIYGKQNEVRAVMTTMSATVNKAEMLAQALRKDSE